MPSLTRIGLALLGLSLAVTPASQAGAPFMKGSYLPPDSKPAKADPNRKEHDPGLEGTLCPDCQRNALAEKGVMVPPPPPNPDGIVVGARPCPKCKRPATMYMTGVKARRTPPMTTVAREPNGHAVVGDVAPPGRAVVNGADPFAEPAPVGLMRANFGGSVGGRPAPADRAAMTPIPPAPTPLTASGGERPNILAHLFGISAMRRDMRDMLEGGTDRKREAHAATAYGPMDQPIVTDVPASMVYGGR
jgi:hypothetical protein